MEKINMYTLPHKTLFAILMLGAAFLPSSALASSVYIDTTHSEYFEGDTILFTVRIDSEGKAINAVEGEIVLDHIADAVSLVDINTSGSPFSLWPGKPLPSERNTRISFTGGSPDGVVSGNAPVFNIVLQLRTAGQVALSPNVIGVYVHDGNGTKDSVSVRELVINVLPKKPGAEKTDDWSAVVLHDTTPPEPFEVYLGQDSSVFDGKKFLSFGTTDGQSGVSYYEVREGALPSTRSNGTYVLHEQNNPVPVVVIAYDSAGNARESAYTPQASAVSHVVVGIGILLFMTLLFVIYRKRRKARK
jgi:hypothetical protein